MRSCDDETVLHNRQTYKTTKSKLTQTLEDIFRLYSNSFQHHQTSSIIMTRNTTDKYILNPISWGCCSCGRSAGMSWEYVFDCTECYEPRCNGCHIVYEKVRNRVSCLRMMVCKYRADRLSKHYIRPQLEEEPSSSKKHHKSKSKGSKSKN